MSYISKINTARISSFKCVRPLGKINKTYYIMFKQQNIINNPYAYQTLYPKIIVLDIPNLEINKYNKYYKNNVNEIKKRINNTYYLKIIELN